MQLFDFAKTHQGLYQNSIPQAKFYASSGFEVKIKAKQAIRLYLKSVFKNGF